MEMQFVKNYLQVDGLMRLGSTGDARQPLLSRNGSVPSVSKQYARKMHFSECTSFIFYSNYVF